MARVPLLASRKEQRAVIRFFWAKGLSAAEIHNEMQPVNGDKCYNNNNNNNNRFKVRFGVRRRHRGPNNIIYRRLKVGAANQNFLVHQLIEQQPNSFFAAGIEKLVPRWDKCQTLLESYV